MPLAVQCPECSAQYRLADELAGRIVRCKCGQRFLVEVDESDQLQSTSVVEQQRLNSAPQRAAPPQNRPRPQSKPGPQFTPAPQFSPGPQIRPGPQHDRAQNTADPDPPQDNSLLELLDEAEQQEARRAESAVQEVIGNLVSTVTNGNSSSAQEYCLERLAVVAEQDILCVFAQRAAGARLTIACETFHQDAGAGSY